MTGKLVGLTLAALIVAANANQATAQITLGARLGFTSSNVGYDPEPIDMSRHNSFGGGAFLRFGTGTLSVQPEVLVITKGVEALDVGDGSGDLALDYVEVPFFARYRAFAGPYAPYLMLGPSFGFEIGCKVTNSETSADGADCDDEGVDRAKLDIGLAAAVGLDLRLGLGNLLLEGRYTYGFTDIADPDPDTVKNRSFGVFVGYAIPLGAAR